MTDGLGTLCRQRMTVMIFIAMAMDVTPDIVRKSAHTTGNSFYYSEP
jgi:hypothetical protein